MNTKMYKYVNENYQDLNFNKLYDDERIYYYPKAQAILYDQKNESSLIKDHPFLKEYVSEEHTMEHFIERTISKKTPIKVNDITMVEMQDVITIAKEEVSGNDQADVFGHGEDGFGEFINEIISDLAGAKIDVLIDSLNHIDGISIKHRIK